MSSRGGRQAPAWSVLPRCDGLVRLVSELTCGLLLLLAHPPPPPPPPGPPPAASRGGSSVWAGITRALDDLIMEPLPVRLQHQHDEQGYELPLDEDDFAAYE
jgi:hypothetical protein